MNKEKALEGIENLIQEGNNVLKTKYNSDLAGTYVNSAIYNSWLAKALAFLKLFLEDDNEFIKGLQKTILLMFTLLNFFVTPINGNITPYFVKTDLQNAPEYLFHKMVTPEMWLSIFSICGGVASTVTAIVISKRVQKDKCGKKLKMWLTILSGIMILIATSYFFFVQIGISLNGFIICFCAFSVLLAMICCEVNIPAHTAVLLTVDKDNLGKVMSLIGVSVQGFIPLASLISGIILNQYGIAWLFVFCAAGFVLTDVIVVSSRYMDEI